jgi:hypothetical protein
MNGERHRSTCQTVRCFGPTTPTHSRVVRRDATIHESIAPKESRDGDNRDGGRSQAGPVLGMRPPWYLRAGEALRCVLQSAYLLHSNASEHNFHYKTLQPQHAKRPWGSLSLASPERASVSSDRSAQQHRRGKWELIAKGSGLTGSKRDEVCPLSNGTGHWRLPGGCGIVTGSRCVIHQLVRRDRRANPWSF